MATWWKWLIFFQFCLGGECVEFFSTTDHPLVSSLAHVECDQRNGFLCDADPQQTTTTAVPSTTTVVPLTCPHGESWKSHEESGYCFWHSMYTESLNWFQAREYCKVYGGDLASYDSAEQQSLALGNNYGHLHGSWIGLKRDENDVFNWVNGAALNYTNWDTDEPNLISPTKFCVSHGSESSRWKLDYCGARQAFVCRVPKMRVTTMPPEYEREEKTKCNITGTSAYSDKWYKYQDHCYLFQEKAEYTWYTARTFCQDNGGNLASIHSFHETDFILNIYLPYFYSSNYWIGLSANALESSFQWTDKTPLDFTYWSDRKEDHRNFTYCVDFNKRDGSWNFSHCSRYQRVICKKGINASFEFTTTEPTTEPMKIMPGNCEKGWYNLGNKCYKLFGSSWNQRESWVKANTECKKMEASLVSIHSEEEQEFLNDIILEVNTDVWIGMQVIERGRLFMSKDLFHWSDDTNVDFTNWKESEPRFRSAFDFPMYSPENPNLCVIMENSRHIGKWNDLLCSAKHSYICQKMKDPANKEPYEDPFACPNITGWHKLGTTCYGLFDQQNLTWIEAQKECQRYKADLMTVRSGAVTSFIERKLKKRNFSDPYFWIGVSEKKPNKYELESQQTFLYDNWMVGQPKAASTDLDNCVAIQRDGAWIVRSCNERHNFICGLDIAEISNSPEVVNDREYTCLNLTGRWQDLGGSHCYMYQKDLKLSWVDAERYCSTHGSYLVSLHSGEEVEKLAKYIGSFYTSYVPSIHIGLRKKEDGSYTWVDTSALDITNWDVGQDPSATSAKECVVMNFRNKKWRTVDCEEYDIRRGFVCSAPKPQTTRFEKVQTPNATQDKDATSITRKLTIGGIFGIVICIVLIVGLIGATVYCKDLPKLN